MRAFGIVSTAIAFLLSSGCVSHTGSASWGSQENRWHIEYDERPDSVEILKKKNGDQYWSNWSADDVDSAMRVGLNAEPGATGGIALAKGDNNLGSLSSAPIQVGDRLKFCAVETASDYSFVLRSGDGGGGISFDSLKPC